MTNKKNKAIILTLLIMFIYCERDNKVTNNQIKKGKSNLTSDNKHKKKLSKNEILRKFTTKISLPKPPQNWKKVKEKQPLIISLPNDQKFSYKPPHPNSTSKEHKFYNDNYFIIIRKLQVNLFKAVSDFYISGKVINKSLTFSIVKKNKHNAYYYESISMMTGEKVCTMIIDSTDGLAYYIGIVLKKKNYKVSNEKIAKQILGSVELN